MAFLCPSDLNPTVLRKEEGVALLQHRSVGSTATPQSVSSKQQDSPESTPGGSSICTKGQQSPSVLSQATEHTQAMN